MLCKIGNCVVLAVSRDIPEAGRIRQRGEGVAIVVSGNAVNSGKAGGSQWKTWSSG